jgi:putative salt-induced outer membrane protein
MRFLALILSSLCLAGFSAHAEDVNGWSGEGSFSAGVSTGNTETTDLGLGVDLTHSGTNWTHTLSAKADFGETDGVETRNRVYLSGRSDRKISETSFVFGQASYEKDEFSGFENRYFFGAGAGRILMDGKKAKWQIRAAPGIKVDEVRETVSNGVVTPSETFESFSVLGHSDFSYQFNDNVALTNTTSAVYAEESTQLTNTVAITAALTETLSARFSFDVRHDTNPPIGFEATDTTTRVSLVYQFGG